MVIHPKSFQKSSWFSHISPRHPNQTSSHPGNSKGMHLVVIKQACTRGHCLCSPPPCVSLSVTSDSLWPQGLYPPGSSVWDSPGKNIGVNSHSLLQGACWTQAANPGLLQCRRILYQLSPQGSPPSPSFWQSCVISGRSLNFSGLQGLL